MDSYTGQICLFAFDFAPNGWARCDGSLLNINQNQTLFSLLGTNYGGDGRTTFGLPNLVGSSPCSAGQGVGLQNYGVGQQFGMTSVTLTALDLPLHTHMPQALLPGRTVPRSGTPTTTSGLTTTSNQPLYSNATADTPMNAAALSPAGGNGSHENRQPFLAMNYSICLQGLYPSRS